MKFFKSLVKGSSSRGRGRRGCDSKIVNLTRHQKWDSILRLLDEHGSEALEDKGTASVHLTYDEYNGGNILHIMCEYHPPSRLVNRVASMFPLLTIQVNSRRQTPLHVAASCGASHRVISTLLKHGGTSPCIMQDLKGYTPLHLHIKHCTPQKQICDPGWSAQPSSSNSMSSSKQDSRKHSNLVPGPDLKVLRLLAEAAPQAINMSDNEGHLPSDLAHHENHGRSAGGHSSSPSNTNKRGSMVAQAASHIMSRSQFIEFAKSATSHTSSSSNRTQMIQTSSSSSNRSLTHSTTAAA